MKERLPSILVAIALLSLVFLGTGCEGDQGPAGPAGSVGPAVLGIYGGAQVYWDGDIVDELYVTVGVSNAPSIPSVKVNGQCIQLYDSWIEYGGRIGYQSDIESETGFDAANLEVTYTMINGQKGVATSTITLPEELNDVPYKYIYPNNDAVISWDPSEGADAYWIDIDYYIDYYDLSSVYQRIDLEYDTILTDTTLTLFAEDLFPDPAEVSSISYFTAYIYIYPVSGPWMPGVTSNIEGNAVGAFVGIADYEYVRIYENTSMSKLMTDNDANTEIEHNPPALDLSKIARELSERKLR